MAKANALVSVSWVDKQIRLGTKNIRILDGSWHLPIHHRNPLEEYNQKHIPGSLYFDITECSAPKGELNLSVTLPSQEAFAKYVGNLGINDETHVVVYENNDALGVLSAPRVWWMFRVFGHDNVSVMDGGLPQWIRDGHGVTDEIPKVQPLTFKPAFKPSLFVSFSDVEANLETGEFQIMDARSNEQYSGLKPESRPDVKPGHVPNAINVPFPSTTHEQDGVRKLKSPAMLKQLFASITALDMGKPLTAMCLAGISSPVLVLAAYLAGKEDVALFDGSWEEYSIRMMAKNPQNIVKG